ncbi:MAG: fasciclin domain-containing protein [Vicinamibacteraceae bacterium]
MVVSLATAAQEETVMVGGAPMYPSKDIIANAMQSADHTTLVAAVKAAGLVDTLQGEGPFTVFAPTNAAFEALPDGTVHTLLRPENQADLKALLTYHVVLGRLDSKALMARLKVDGGKTTLETGSRPVEEVFVVQRERHPVGMLGRPGPLEDLLAPAHLHVHHSAIARG